MLLRNQRRSSPFWRISPSLVSIFQFYSIELGRGIAVITYNPPRRPPPLAFTLAVLSLSLCFSLFLNWQSIRLGCGLCAPFETTHASLARWLADWPLEASGRTLPRVNTFSWEINGSMRSNNNRMIPDKPSQQLLFLLVPPTPSAPRPTNPNPLTSLRHPDHYSSLASSRHSEALTFHRESVMKRGVNHELFARLSCDNCFRQLLESFSAL